MKTIAPLIIAASLLAGCQTPRTFPTPDSRWRTSIGQLQYVTPARSVIGEVVVSTSGAEDFQLDFVSGPGVPLLKLREHGGFGRAEGIFARGSWQGETSRAPARLQSWFALREQFRATRQANVKVDFPRSGEHFVFRFNR